MARQIWECVSMLGNQSGFTVIIPITEGQSVQSRGRCRIVRSWRRAAAAACRPKAPIAPRLRWLRLAAPLAARARRRTIRGWRSTRWGWIFPIRSAWRRASTRMREVPDAMARFGFGFVECGTVTPRPQAGNPTPAPVPAQRRPRRHQPHGLQQCAAWQAAARNLASARKHAASSASISAPTRTAPTASPIMRQAFDTLAAAGRLCHGQCLLAQHAGPARIAESGRTDPPAAGSDRRARRKAASKISAPAQDRARSGRTCAGRYRRGGAAQPASKA